MAKLSRTVLKEIVKECIVEIFEESFFAKGNPISESKSNKRDYIDESNYQRKRRPKVDREYSNTRPSLDNVSYGSNTVKNERFDNKINEVTKSITSDPLMAEIFKDTAKTTMQSQASAETGRRQPSVLASGDKAALKANQSDPMDLFAESAGKWATLAFSNPVNK